MSKQKAREVLSLRDADAGEPGYAQPERSTWLKRQARVTVQGRLVRCNIRIQQDDYPGDSNDVHASQWLGRDDRWL